MTADTPRPTPSTQAGRDHDADWRNLLRMVDVAVKHYASSKGRAIPEMEMLSKALGIIGPIESQHPALAIEAEARDATGLREALTDTRTILSAHILRLARYHRLDRGHLGTFTHEAIALIDAALATAPPEPRWPSNAVHESANDGFGPDPLGAPPEPRWPSPDDEAAVEQMALAVRGRVDDDTKHTARTILAALREGGDR